MGPKMKFLFYLLTCAYVASAFSTDRDSWVVSSTEPSKDISDKNSKGYAVPILPKIYEMKVRTNVTNRFAKTTVISKVKNSAKSAQEATFSVVLPKTACISGFVMEIDGKSYEAYVEEWEKARQIYNEAVVQGQAAAHIVRDSKRFTVSVNVEPKKKAVFTLTYEELLQRQDEQYEIVINIHPGQPVEDLNVEVQINESRPLKFVRSPHLRSGNGISKNNDALASLAHINIINSTTATVKFSPNVERQKQLAAGLGTKEENGLAGQFVVQYDVERDPQGGEILLKDGYFVHFFAPSEVKPLPKEVIFILDTSGTTRIKQLKEAMNSMLAELKEEDLFSIVEFNSVVKLWNIEKVEVEYEFHRRYYSIPEKSTKNKTNQPLPLPYKAGGENINKAKQVVSKLKADGFSDIQSALEFGIKIVKKSKEDRNNTHQPIIILLTDGHPTNGETTTVRIISAISEINSGAIKSPIFSLSLGDDANRDFLQKLSLKNLGFSRHIYEAADASLQAQEFFRQTSPLLNNVKFTCVSNASKLTKTEFPIFFHGSELVVSGVIEDRIIDPGFAPCTIDGNGFGGPIHWVPKTATPVGDLERIWAYLTVKQILKERDAAENKTELTKRALDIALKYSFDTPVNSFVVVKPNDTRVIVNTRDASKSFVLPPPDFEILPAFGSEEEFFTESATTSFPPQKPTQDPYEEIKTKLPWLKNILSDNGTVTISLGNYQLSIEDITVPQPECPKTPVNGSNGICTPLIQCPQVFSYLRDVQEFNKYFCPLNTYVGICCPRA